MTAEAVEIEVQAERLRALRCDTGQGRWFGPPMPAADIRRRLERKEGPRLNASGGEGAPSHLAEQRVSRAQDGEETR